MSNDQTVKYSTWRIFRDNDSRQTGKIQHRLSSRVIFARRCAFKELDKCLYKGNKGEENSCHAM